jgi:protein-disulfide isomerase
MIRLIVPIMLFIIVVGRFDVAGMAQEFQSDLRSEIEELKKGQEMIRKDLMEIKALLSKGAVQPNALHINVKGIEFEISNGPIKGSDRAKFIMVEFTDYQCPFCSRYVRDTLPQIAKQYIDNGRIKYAIVDNPLPMHKMAGKAAEASHCASDQGKFWDYHELVMTKQDSIEDLSSYAGSLNLDTAKYEDCLNTNKYRDEVAEGSVLAQKLGINGAPGFVIASVDPQNPKKVKGISFIRGALPFANFQKELDSALSSNN